MAARERPILFSGPMVRAILEGRKTQTRRLYKPRYPEPYEVVEDGIPLQCDEAGDYHRRLDPYGTPGDRLWVREAWRTSMNHDSAEAAGFGDRHIGSCIEYAADRASPGKGWRPSIFMVRGASRITLEVTDVRVQRLQDISEEDAQAEGVTLSVQTGPTTMVGRPFASEFRLLWDSINAERAAWVSNPWVWAVSFRRAPIKEGR